MGQSESAPCLKRFVNSPQEAVSDTLEGLLWTNPNVCGTFDSDVHIVVQKGWEKDKVAVVAAGGAGHEPADVGLVGKGLLTAAVCGEVFTPPSPESVSRLLTSVTGPMGCLVVIRNHFSTVLAAKAGISAAKGERGWPKGAEVRIVTVADDVATAEWQEGGMSFRQSRGVAGTTLVMKVAGAAAEAGLSLDEVAKETAEMASLVRTQGVCYTSCTVPGQPNMRPIPADEMEVGCGIHGEVSRTRAKATTTAREIVQMMVKQLSAFVPDDAPLCVLLNNLGSVPANEMLILASEVMKSDVGDRVELFVGPSSYVTSLDTNGFSLSIAPLDAKRVERLQAKAECPYWRPPVEPSAPWSRQFRTPRRNSTFMSFSSSADVGVHRIMTRVCEELVSAENELNALDSHFKNGDCGRNLAHAARLLQEQLDDWPMASPQEFCRCMASLLRRVEGALCALMSTFFFQAGQSIRSDTRWGDPDLLDCFEHALGEVMALVDFKEGMRTFADALGPAIRAAKVAMGPGVCVSRRTSILSELEHLRAISEGPNAAEDSRKKLGVLSAAAEAALRGARQTAYMEGARGQSAYASRNLRQGSPDSGAMAVAFVLSIAASPSRGRFIRIENDTRLLEHYTIGAEIGKGAYGQVCQAVRKYDGQKMAIKSSERRREVGLRSFEDLDFVERKRMLNWLFAEKPNIVIVHEALASPASVHLVMEVLEGPSVSDWLTEQPKITETVVARCVKQMLTAVRSIHLFGLIHRDLKADNFVFTDATCSWLKLVDVVGTMQFQAVVDSGKRSICGTGPYLSPEALIGQCTTAADIWAIGVTMHLIVSRQYPFDATSLRDLHKAQQQGLKLEGPSWQAISSGAKDLVQGLLALDPICRPSCEEALDDPWLNLVGRSGDSNSSSPLPVSSSQLPDTPRTLSSLGTVPGSLARQESPGRLSEKWAVVKTLYLIRHGEALHNIEERGAKIKALTEAKLLGASPQSAKELAESARQAVLEDEALKDAALSLDGKVMALNAQAEINQLLTEGYQKPSCVLVSPLERTLQTAALIFPGHKNTHVVEALRERRTGLPCDERKRAEEVAMRSTFQHMSFEHLCRQDSESKVWICPPNLNGLKLLDACTVEDKKELRRRCQSFLQTVAEMEEDSIAIVTHKGFLREMERGPLGRESAEEFGNCEVRVYDVTFPRDGGDPIGLLRHQRSSP